MAKTENITAAEIKEAFAYDPETGVFTRKIRIGRRGKLTDPVGSIHVHGYRRIKYKTVSLLASRVAWAVMTGSWPDSLIDHMNGDRADDRWANLRQATYMQNAQNRKPYDRPGKKPTGAHWSKNGNRWQAVITVNRNRIFLGYFKTADEAHAEYLRAKANLHPFQPVPRSDL